MSNRLDNIGFSCDVFRAKNETEHFHRDFEMLFVINGHIHVVTERHEYRVETEEFLFINSSKRHYIYVDEEALVCRLNISYDLFTDVFSKDYIAFWCNTITKNDPAYQELNDLIRKIIRLKIDSQDSDTFLLMEYYGKFLYLLTSNYMINAGEKDGFRKDSEDSHIKEIIAYINNNYYETLNLTDLADKMYVSVSTMSRIFKKATGIKFPDYINQIRLHHAIDDLLNTNKSVTEIAVDNGFSSPSSFNRVFREVYDTTPSQYKKSVRSNLNRSNTKLTSEEKTHVMEYLEDVPSPKDSRPGEQLSVTDLYTDTEMAYHPISTRAVSLGAFYQLTNSSVQKQIAQMAEQLGLEYIRMWNIFSPKCMIAVSPDEKQLSFEYIDIVFDFLVSIHVHPFLDMTDHPECLIKDGRKLFFRRDDSMGFQNLEQWNYFLEKLMEHVTFRYGHEEVSRWIFEFGDYHLSQGLEYYLDCDAYYEGNTYKEVFETAYHTIKSVCPEAMVGGPDWVYNGKKVDLKPYFDVWDSMGIYPDFYSVHIFPAIDQEDNDNKNERILEPDFVKNQMMEIVGSLNDIKAPERPLFITEMTSILSNRNAINDHLFRGTNTLRITNLLQDYADMICFWVATDRQSLHYAPREILHGGSGLMSKDGLPKPAYYALYFLSKLGNRMIGRGAGFLAVQNSPNNIYILCYNHKDLVYDYKYDEEYLVNVYNVDSMFENNFSRNLRFMVHGLEQNQEYVIKRHMVNQDHGSIMDEWKRLGYEPEMRKNDIQYLKSVCVPRIKMEHRVAEEGQIFLEAELKAHEMLLLHIYK